MRVLRVQGIEKQFPPTWLGVGPPCTSPNVNQEQPSRGPRQFFERSNYFPNSHGFGYGSPKSVMDGAIWKLQCVETRASYNSSPFLGPEALAS